MKLRLVHGWRLARLRMAFGVAMCCVTMAAKADIWAYIDEAGVARFAAEQIDERYHLFYREPKPTQATESTPTAPLAGPSVAAPSVVEMEFQRRSAWLERLPQFRKVLGLLQEAAGRFNIDTHLLSALVAAESGFNPEAISPKGALGLMQLMPETALRYGVALDGPDQSRRRLFDPALNVSTGTRHLRDLLNMFEGKLDLALAAYNAGAGAVQRAGNQIPAYRETQNYVRTVLGLYAALSPPAPTPTPTPPVIKPEAKAAPIPPGGALGRRNMIAPLGNTAPPLPVLEIKAPTTSP